MCFVISDETRMQSGGTLSSKKSISFIEMEILNRNFTWEKIQNNLELFLEVFFG